MILRRIKRIHVSTTLTNPGVSFAYSEGHLGWRPAAGAIETRLPFGSTPSPSAERHRSELCLASAGRRNAGSEGDVEPDDESTMSHPQRVGSQRPYADDPERGTT